jgi:hypothetical protein
VITLHSLVHSHGLGFLLGAYVCKAMKSNEFPLILFMLLDPSSLGGAVEDGRLVCALLSESEMCEIDGGLGCGQAGHMTPLSAFAFAL